MTPKQYKSLARYIVGRAWDLGLGGWQITLLTDRPDSDAAAAEVECIYGRKIAKIKVAADWLDLTPEQHRVCVIHELLHIQTDQTWQLVHETLPSLLGKPAFTAFLEGYRQANEHGVDAIADAIAPHFPLWDCPK